MLVTPTSTGIGKQEMKTAEGFCAQLQMCDITQEKL